METSGRGRPASPCPPLKLLRAKVKFISTYATLRATIQCVCPLFVTLQATISTYVCPRSPTLRAAISTCVLSTISNRITRSNFNVCPLSATLRTTISTDVCVYNLSTTFGQQFQLVSTICNIARAMAWNNRSAIFCLLIL